VWTILDVNEHMPKQGSIQKQTVCSFGYIWVHVHLGTLFSDFTYLFRVFIN
jgi:hypothetical protein